MSSFSKCNLLISAIFVFLSVSLTSSKIVAHSCAQLTQLVLGYCETQSGPNPLSSQSLHRNAAVCCYNLKMHKCLIENHNATCPPLPGTAKYLMSNFDCSQFSDLSKCNSFYDLISPASVTFITVSIICIIFCLCFCVFCRLFAKNDNHDLSSCQLTDFKVSSKSDLKHSSSLSPINVEENCHSTLVTFSDEPKSIEKDDSHSLPVPVHLSLVDLSVEFPSSSTSNTSNTSDQ